MNVKREKKKSFAIGERKILIFARCYADEQLENELPRGFAVFKVCIFACSRSRTFFAEEYQ